MFQGRQILDCTLRDGSYQHDFKFTADDTTRICGALDRAGVRLIEVGHGLGLGASEAGHGSSAATDEEYVAAAAASVRNAAWGVFFQPAIGTREQLDMAIDHGMDFVRIGANVTEVETLPQTVEYALGRGLAVSVNLMKSYSVPAAVCGDVSARCAAMGAGIVVLVDSAGCMTPSDIHAYVTEMREKADVPIGFHGHDNLGLANANALMAWSAGASVVDGTLRGIGRGGGNATTEALAAIMCKDEPEAMDIKALAYAAADIVDPLVAHSTHLLDVICGYSGFHSSFIETAGKWAERYEVDPVDMVIALAKNDPVHVSPETARRIAEELRTRIQPPSGAAEEFATAN